MATETIVFKSRYFKNTKQCIETEKYTKTTRDDSLNYIHCVQKKTKPENF